MSHIRSHVMVCAGTGCTSSESPKVLADRILLTSPERIHTIVPGLLVFKTVAKFFSSQRFIVSEYGVREGYLLHVLKEEGVLDG